MGVPIISRWVQIPSIENYSEESENIVIDAYLAQPDD